MAAKRIPLLGFFLASGIAASLVYAVLYHAGLTTLWQKTGSLSEPVASVDGMQDGILYVRTTGGSQYAYLVDPTFHEVMKPGWQTVTSRSVSDESQPAKGRWRSFPLLHPAREVYEAEITYNIEGTAYLRLAAGPDNSLWLWKVTRPWGESLVMVWFIIPGFLAGLLVWALARLACGLRRAVQSVSRA